MPQGGRGKRAGYPPPPQGTRTILISDSIVFIEKIVQIS